MRDRVHRPRIVGIALHCAAPGSLRLPVIAGFLESKRIHAEHVTVSRRRLIPGMEYSRHRITQLSVVTEIEVHKVRELEGKNIARVVEQDCFPYSDRRP